MRLREVSVRNFRCLKDVTVPVESLSALVGSNGSGKSALLRAIQVFYEGPHLVSNEDFCDRDPDDPIEIALSFDHLTKQAATELGEYAVDGLLRFVLRIEPDSDPSNSAVKLNANYYGESKSHPEFDAVRKIQRAPERLAGYKELRASEKYDLPAATSWSAANKELQNWEQAHPDECQLVESPLPGFLPPGAGAALGNFTRLIFVPAVADAADEATADRGNTIGQLVNLLVENVAESQEVTSVKAEFEARYIDVIKEKEKITLPELEQALTAALHDYVPNASVKLEWEGASVRVDPPRTRVKLDDGFLGDVEGKGHGLQRLFIVSMLQYAATIHQQHRSDSRDSEDGETSAIEPDYVLLIEEPELYQHPLQARRFAQALRQLSVKSEAPRVQVIYSTHSPFFVGVDRFDGVRLFRRRYQASVGTSTSVEHASLDDVAQRVNAAFQRDEYSLTRFREQLRSIMTPAVAEGFFAQTLVLVEGDEDKAVIEAALRLSVAKFDALGIAVIGVDGKNNMDRAFTIFDSLGIPTYFIFDADAEKTGDKQERAAVNRALQRLASVDDPVDFPESAAHARFAVFHRDLTKDVRDEYGHDRFVQLRDEVAEEMGWKGDLKLAQKNPAVLGQVLLRLHNEENRSDTLDSIVDMIRKISAAGELTP